MTQQYVMRAFNTTILGHVYWSVLGAPDMTGAQSGYNPADLTSITVDYTLQVPINGEGGISQTGLAGGDLTGTYPNPTIAVTAPLQQVFNVRTYGAKGDGTTDDTAAIQAAITAMPSPNGSTLFFPSGIYNCGTININKPVKMIVDSASIVSVASVLFAVTSNMVVEGTSRLASSIISSNGGKLFNITDTFNNSVDGYAHFTLKNITLLGNGSARAVDTSGLALANFGQGLMVFEDCSFTGFGNTAIYLQPEVNFVHIVRNTFTYNQRSVYFGDTGTAWIKDNQFLYGQPGTEQVFLTGQSGEFSGNVIGSWDNINGLNTAPDILLGPANPAFAPGELWITKNRFMNEGEGNNHLRPHIRLQADPGHTYEPVWITENSFLGGAGSPITAATMTRNGSHLVTVTSVLPHTAVTGGIFYVEGAVDTSFNGLYTITVVDIYTLT